MSAELIIHFSMRSGSTLVRWICSTQKYMFILTIDSLLHIFRSHSKPANLLYWIIAIDEWTWQLCSQQQIIIARIEFTIVSVFMIVKYEYKWGRIFENIWPIYIQIVSMSIALICEYMNRWPRGWGHRLHLILKRDQFDLYEASVFCN